MLSGPLRPLYENSTHQPRGQTEKAKGQLPEAALRAEWAEWAEWALAGRRQPGRAAPAAADRTPSCAHRGWEQAQPPRTEQRERRSPPRRGRFCAGHWTSWDRCWARDGKASHGALVLAQMSDLHSSCKWLFPEMFRRKLTISIQFKMPLI